MLPHPLSGCPLPDWGLFGYRSSSSSGTWVKTPCQATSSFCSRSIQVQPQQLQARAVPALHGLQLRQVLQAPGIQVWRVWPPTH